MSEMSLSDIGDYAVNYLGAHLIDASYEVDVETGYVIVITDEGNLALSSRMSKKYIRVSLFDLLYPNVKYRMP